MLKKLKDFSKNEKPKFIIKIRQPYKNGMRYGYIDGELICKEPTKQRCLRYLDTRCKNEIKENKLDEEERTLKKLYKYKSF